MARFFAVLFFVLTAVTHAAEPAASRSQTLLHATSPYEDMVKVALARSDSDIAKYIEKADLNAAAVKAALSGEAAPKFELQLKGLHQAAADKSYLMVATKAVELFRLLIDNVDPVGLPIPIEVDLLDYTGYQLQVLAAAPQPDWSAIRKLAAEGAAWWEKIRLKTSDKHLRATVNSTMAGLQEAVKSENLPMLRMAGQIDLDLVDLLEVNFKPLK